MNILDRINSHNGPGFSIEVLPPLKGKGISQLFSNIDKLIEFINEVSLINLEEYQQKYKEKEGD